MTVPAGWYDDGSGRQRWWDGAQWTEHFAPVEPAAPAAPAAPVAPVPEAQRPDAAADAADETAEEIDLDATVRREDIPRAASASEAAHEAAPVFEAEAPAPAAPAVEIAPTAYEPPAYAPPSSPTGYAAPAAANPAYLAPAYSAPAYSAAPPAPKSHSVLGFVGLGLAALGLVLACIPTSVTLFSALAVLLAGLVLSIVAVSRKGTRKWPAITGIIVAVVGGIIGIIVAVGLLIVSTMNAVVSEVATAWPTPMTSQQPGDTSADRPLPAQITAGFLLLVAGQEDIERYTEPGAAACIGQHLYDSDLSDEALQAIASGQPVPDDVYFDVQQASDEAADACVTQ